METKNFTTNDNVSINLNPALLVDKEKLITQGHTIFLYDGKNTFMFSKRDTRGINYFKEHFSEMAGPFYSILDFIEWDNDKDIGFQTDIPWSLVHT